jgi:hypothetical protein
MMKIVKIEDHYYLLEEVMISKGDFMWNGLVMYKVVMNLSTPYKGWRVVGTTNEELTDIPKMNKEQIEKPVPTSFSQEDMMQYTNWVLEWCSANKYRKSAGGVLPFGLGEPMTDSQLFEKYIEYIRPKDKKEWLDVEANIYGNIVEILKAD